MKMVKRMVCNSLFNRTFSNLNYRPRAQLMARKRRKRWNILWRPTSKANIGLVLPKLIMRLIFWSMPIY